MLIEYINKAMSKAVYEKLEDGAAYYRRDRISNCHRRQQNRFE